MKIRADIPLRYLSRFHKQLRLNPVYLIKPYILVCKVKEEAKVQTQTVTEIFIFQENLLLLENTLSAEHKLGFKTLIIPF